MSAGYCSFRCQAIVRKNSCVQLAVAMSEEIAAKTSRFFFTPSSPNPPKWTVRPDPKHRAHAMNHTVLYARYDSTLTPHGSTSLLWRSVFFFSLNGFSLAEKMMTRMILGIARKIEWKPLIMNPPPPHLRIIISRLTLKAQQGPVIYYSSSFSLIMHRTRASQDPQSPQH